LENQKKMNSCQVITPHHRAETTPKKDVVAMVENVSIMTSPMEIESSIAPFPSLSTNTATEQNVLKKKKKKTSYKAMMAAMTSSDAPRDLEKEKDAIRKATGGGVFAKIDKI
jgi:hypothetical protein